MRIVGWVLVALFSLLLPNLIWIGKSTVRIHNATIDKVVDVGYSACDTKHSIGELAPGASYFRFLKACGDDTLIIHLSEASYCQTYVEGELYHVDATIIGPGEVRCKYDDLLSSLFVSKLLF